MKYRIFGRSVRGASHIRSGTPCQDSHKIYQINSGTVILAVADGHGNKACPHSDDGSRIAADVFCRVMKEYHKSYGKKLTAFAGHIEKAAKTIDTLWKKSVLKEHKMNGREMPETKDKETQRVQIYKMYGTTLVGMLITPAFIFAFQLGDGDIIYTDGLEVSGELRIGEKALGTETHSLSSIDSHKLVKTKLIRAESAVKPPCMFMLSTDGFANSYKDDTEFEKSCRDYFDMIKTHGADAVEANLEQWLAQTSFEGCGDDVTLVIAYYES